MNWIVSIDQLQSHHTWTNHFSHSEPGAPCPALRSASFLRLSIDEFTLKRLTLGCAWNLSFSDLVQATNMFLFLPSTNRSSNSLLSLCRRYQCDLGRLFIANQRYQQRRILTPVVLVHCRLRSHGSYNCQENGNILDFIGKCFSDVVLILRLYRVELDNTLIGEMIIQLYQNYKKDSERMLDCDCYMVEWRSLLYDRSSKSFQVFHDSASVVRWKWVWLQFSPDTPWFYLNSHQIRQSCTVKIGVFRENWSHIHFHRTTDDESWKTWKLLLDLSYNNERHSTM